MHVNHACIVHFVTSHLQRSLNVRPKHHRYCWFHHVKHLSHVKQTAQMVQIVSNSSVPLRQKHVFNSVKPENNSSRQYWILDIGYWISNLNELEIMTTISSINPYVPILCAVVGAVYHPHLRRFGLAFAPIAIAIHHTNMYAGSTTPIHTYCLSEK